MEIPFEYLLAGIETAHGTALNPPTKNLGLVGTVKPMMERYRPSEQRGKLAENTTVQDHAQVVRVRGRGSAGRGDAAAAVECAGGGRN